MNIGNSVFLVQKSWNSSLVGTSLVLHRSRIFLISHNIHSIGIGKRISCVFILDLLVCRSNNNPHPVSDCINYSKHDKGWYEIFHVVGSQEATVCWGEIKWKKMPHQKFFQNPLLGCLWNILKGGKKIFCPRA